ncbi:MAG: M20/M25/M40 family metallo-hydrolase, partial [Nitrospirae bacterium]
LGFEVRWASLPPETGRAGHLIAIHPGDRGRRLLLLGHLDTVLQGEPFRRDGDRAWGSGVSDMKGGDVILIEALRALYATGALQGRAITVVLTGDEERAGQPHEVSRGPLLEAAKDVDVVLAFEGYATGYAVVGRRGSSSWRLEVEAKQAHSSGIFNAETGDGAVFELARILDSFRRELPEPQLTFNPSLVIGGTNATLGKSILRI